MSAFNSGQRSKFCASPDHVRTGRHTPPLTSVPSNLSSHNAAIEPSKDYLKVPTCAASADSILMWPIFNASFVPDSLIEGLFQHAEHSVSEQVGSQQEPASHYISENLAADILTVPGGLRSISDERIPCLVDRFLQNVHTKNPILDVDLLVQWGRAAAENGLGWNAQSCLVLLACALGSISYPFVKCLTSAPGRESISVGEPVHGTSAASSASIYSSELQQGESCFILACRRTGLLKHTVLGSQCHFFAAGKCRPPIAGSPARMTKATAYIIFSRSVSDVYFSPT